MFDKTRTKTGQLKTDKNTLKKIGGEFTSKLLRYKELDKLQSTYLVSFLEKLDSKSRVHGMFNQAGTVTGRLSSSRPNLQNISTRSEEGHKIRELFIPSPNHKLVVGDLSQIELRVMAHYSQEPKMLEVYKNGGDIHTQTAQLAFETEEPSAMQRRAAKTANFAIGYGATAERLRETIVNESPEPIDFTLSDAYRLMNNFKKGYPRLTEWMEEVKEYARKKEYVQTTSGRRILVPGINSSNKWKKEAGERQAVNYLIQGTASEIMKIIMVELVKRNPEIGLISSVHDEVVVDSFNWKEDLKLVKDVMENTVKLNNVRTEADVKVCETWGNK